MKKKSLQILILGAAFTAAAFDDGFKPYRTIIERMPFGRPPADFNPDAPGTSVQAKEAAKPKASPVDLEQEKLAERIRATVRVCALNVPPNGEPVVGFTDAAYTPPRNHLLAQGQTADGWTVVEIDAEARRAVLEREGVSVRFALGGGVGEVEIAENRAQKEQRVQSPPPQKLATRTQKPNKFLKRKSDG